MNTHRLATFILLGSMFLVAFAPSAIAADDDIDVIGDPDTTFTNPLGETDTIGKVLVNIIRWLLGITGALALLAIIWSGIQFIISIGNEQQLQRAKKSLMWAIIGLVVIFLAFVIVELIFTSLTGRAPTP